jgi:hypothetical protein
MAQQTINIGTAPNDNTGDPLRTGMTKANANFTENYTTLAAQATTNSNQATTNASQASTNTTVANQISALQAFSTTETAYTPTLTDSLGGATFTGTGTGHYVYISANLVWVNAIYTVATVTGTATGQLFFSLPLLRAHNITMSVFGDNLAAACKALSCQTAHAYPYSLRIYDLTAGTATSIATHVQAGTILRITGLYYI